MRPVYKGDYFPFDPTDQLEMRAFLLDKWGPSYYWVRKFHGNIGVEYFLGQGTRKEDRRFMRWVGHRPNGSETDFYKEIYLKDDTLEDMRTTIKYGFFDLGFPYDPDEHEYD